MQNQRQKEKREEEEGEEEDRRENKEREKDEMAINPELQGSLMMCRWALVLPLVTSTFLRNVQQV